MLGKWYRRSDCLGEEDSFTFEDTTHRYIRFMNKDQIWKLYTQMSLNVSGRNSQYRTISPELEKAGNFFMKRFTVRA